MLTIWRIGDAKSTRHAREDGGSTFDESYIYYVNISYLYIDMNIHRVDNVDILYLLGLVGYKRHRPMLAGTTAGN